MFEELKELICEYVDVEPSAICEESRFIECKDCKRRSGIHPVASGLMADRKGRTLCR